MSKSFQVGDPAFIRKDIRPYVREEMAQYLGAAVVVEGPLRFVHGWREPLYIVRSLTDGMPFYAAAWTLVRDLPPPDADTLDTATPLKRTKWIDSPWKPQGVKAHG